jgi:hypothetical protein
MMVFKVLLIAAFVLIVNSDVYDNFPDFVYDEDDWDIFSDPFVDIKMAAYYSKNCTGKKLENITCDGKTCQDFVEYNSLKVGII